MVKKCIVVSNETAVTQLLACFIKSMNLGVTVVERGNSDDIINDFGEDEEVAVIFTPNTYCVNLEIFCQKVYEKNPFVFLICFCAGKYSQHFGFRLYKAGVNCVIERTKDTFEFTTILKNAMAGHSYYPQVLLDAVDRREHLLIGVGKSDLTEREKSIIYHVASRYPFKFIANKLNVTETTISTTLSRIIKKLGVHCKDEAVKVLIQQGVLAEISV